MSYIKKASINGVQYDIIGQGVVNKNSNTSSPKYDWVGTSAEYTAQNIAVAHPDWVCYITDDTSSESVYTKTEVNTLLTTKQNTLSAQQLSAVNSGITLSGVSQINTNAQNITALQANKYGKSISYSGTTLTLSDQDNNVLSTANIAGALATLTDTTITSPTIHQGLVYNGSKWVNGSAVHATYDAVNERITIA